MQFNELSLYLEIVKYEGMLREKKEEALMMPGDSLSIQIEIEELSKKILECKKYLSVFGISMEDAEEVQKWKWACSDFLNQLSIVEYATFIDYRAHGKNLDIFCVPQEGKSYFLTKRQKKF